MKSIIKRTAAIFLASAAIAVCPILSEASTLKTADGIRYIVYDNGETKPYTGWTTKSGKRYYYKNGVMKKSCWLNSNGQKKYFLTSDGSAAVGKVTVSGIEYEFDDKGIIIPEEWGITLSAGNVTPTGMTVTYLWDGTDTGGSLEYGQAFEIERYAGGKWEKVPYISDNGVWFTEEAFLLSENETATKKDWEDIYGELPPGRYRFCTDINNYRAPGDCDIRTYYAYFTL